MTPGDTCTSQAARMSVAVLLLFAAAAHSVSAEDLVDRKGAKAALRGEISGSTRTELTLKSPNRPDVKIPANEIVRVRFGGEKPQLLQVRSAESTGSYRKALEGYLSAAREVSAAQANLKTDLEFLIARTTAKLAAEEPALAADAAKKLDEFLKAHPENFRYYEAVLLLGNVHLAGKNGAAARAAFQQLSQAPWDDYRLAARNAAGRLLLAEDKVDEALREFEAVLASTSSEKVSAAARHEASMGKATCLERKKDFAQAAQVYEQILEDAVEEDTALQAEVSVRLGSCLQAAGKTREAILAYLRVDLLFSKEQRWRPEALYHLSQLWERDSKPDRAAAAATALQTDYPNSDWAKKLALAPAK